MVRDYYAVAIKQLRWIPSGLRTTLGRTGLMEDLLQSLRLAAIESERHGENLKQASNRAQRALYRCLRDYGFRRPRGAGYFKKMEEGLW